MWGGRKEEYFFRVLTAREPTRAFFVLPLRGRPLADTSPARVVRKAASSKNSRVIPAKQPRQSPKEILCLHNLRFADAATVEPETIEP
jgi:hypothetical protein